MEDDNANEWGDDGDYKSKTQRKAEMAELQELGIAIAQLPEKLVASFSLSDVLHKAINDYKKIKHKNALRRQSQFIGKLMRSENTEAIKQQWELLQEERHRETRQFHLVEQWRDRLIHEGPPALNDFLENYPETSRQQLLQNLRAIAQERTSEKAPVHSRKLFKLIQSVIAQH